jgi:hypothetical protein
MALRWSISGSTYIFSPRERGSAVCGGAIAPVLQIVILDNILVQRAYCASERMQGHWRVDLPELMSWNVLED